MSLLKSIRYKEWLFSKIPLMAVPMLGYIINSGTTKSSIFMLIQWIIFLICFYAFGYIINDYCDREVDKIVGKENSLLEVSKLNASIRVFIVFAVGFFVAIINHIDVRTLVIITAIYVLGASYSAKPFRFKEKGILGVIVSSFAQRSMPLILLISYINIDLFDLILWMLLGFLVGLRYILIHQYMDLNNDLESGVETFLTKRTLNVEPIIKAILIIELIIVIVFGCVYSNMIVFSFVSLVYAIQMYFSFLTVHKIYKENYWCSYICVPMEDYYNFYLPVIWMINLVFANGYWSILIFLFTLSMLPILKKKVEIPIFYFKCKGWKKWTR